MQPDKTELNALYKTFHYAEKWIHFWKRESKSARIMDRYQCPCVFAICQSPWVNAIHPGQGTFLTWTVNYRKTEDKRRASIQLYVKDGDAKSSSLWNITTEWWSVAHRSVAPLNKIKNCKRWEDSSDQQPCMRGGEGVMIVYEETTNFWLCFRILAHIIHLNDEQGLYDVKSIQWLSWRQHILVQPYNSNEHFTRNTRERKEKWINRQWMILKWVTIFGIT